MTKLAIPKIGARMLNLKADTKTNNKISPIEIANVINHVKNT